MSNLREGINYSGEEKVAILRAHFVEGLLVQKNEVISKRLQKHVQLKSQWGPLSQRWVPHDTRDQIVDDVNRRTERTEISAQRTHSAIGYVTPLDMLEGRQKAIHEERDPKLEEARRTRADRRRQKKSSTPRKASRQSPDPDVSSSISQ
ncbi:MAG UNVERIFIED_CONTAM: hypothetical protein LVR18_34275 [Planctomycetaceae bacterium]